MNAIDGGEGTLDTDKLDGVLPVSKLHVEGDVSHNTSDNANTLAISAFNADFHDQYNAHYFPAGGNPTVLGSRAWFDRITGNSTACYFNAPGCPRR